LKLLLYTAGVDGSAWVDALARALPEAKIQRWPDADACAIDYALVWKPPKGMLADLRSAKAIFNLGAGVDALLAMPGWPAELPLIRLEDAGMAEQMSEYVLHAVLRWYREFDAYAQAQRERAWRPRRRLGKEQFSIGLLGAGVLGHRVASSLRALGFPVLAWSRTRKDMPGVRSYAGGAELDDFLGETRVLVCMLPLTTLTRGLLNGDVLARLPTGAYLINVARGAVCVEADLLELIDSGHLAGAALDVFNDEPLPAASAFWHHPRIVVTPHVSAVTLLEDSVVQIAAKIRRLEAGLTVTGVVDPERAY
jgi:glyoxylate/hydroxypyruvate reductase A